MQPPSELRIRDGLAEIVSAVLNPLDPGRANAGFRNNRFGKAFVSRGRRDLKPGRLEIGHVQLCHCGNVNIRAVEHVEVFRQAVTVPLQNGAAGQWR
jgi:hypothetical protein